MVTIAAKGNGTDFGDPAIGGNYHQNGCSSSVRGLVAGGAGPALTTSIQSITMASSGSSEIGGDLTAARNRPAATSTETRAVFYGGATNGNDYSIIDFVSIASLGNAQDFGDLVHAHAGTRGSASPTRAIFVRWDVGVATNNIDYVQIMTTGNAVDFGDQDPGLAIGANFSNGHGGLG